MKYLAIGLFLVFILLKLAGIGDVASWSYVWVLSPLWIYVCLEIFIGNI